MGLNVFFLMQVEKGVPYTRFGRFNAVDIPFGTNIKKTASRSCGNAPALSPMDERQIIVYG